MDFPFILRNYTGLILARFLEQNPALMPRLRRSRSSLKPFIAARLRGEKLDQYTIQDFGPFKMHLRLSDDVQRQIYLGLYENEEIEACRGLVRPGATCIDVGANVGWFTLHFASWVGKSGRVIACEADPDVASELRANCDLNTFSSIIRIHNVAVADVAGPVRFLRSSPQHSGWGSVLPQDGNRGGPSIEVPAITLDELLSGEEVGQVDLLKIDVEGFEFAVLRARQSHCAGERSVMSWSNGPAEGRPGMGRAIDELHTVFASNGYEPNGPTAKLLEQMLSGEKDVRTTLANLMYRYNARGSNSES